MKKHSKSPGVIVLLGGLLLLLYQLNILGLQLINALMIFWPLFIIVIGIDIAFNSRLLKLSAWIVAILIILFFSLYGNNYSFYNDKVVEYSSTKTIDMNEINSRRYDKTEQGHGNLDISSFSQKIVVKSTDIADIISEDSIAFKLTKRAHEVDYVCDAFRIKKSQDDGVAPLYLSDEKVWQVDFSSADIDLIVDDRDLAIQKMNCSAAEASVDYTFSGQYPTELQIDAFKADVTIHTSRQMPLRVKTDSINRNFSVDGKIIDRAEYVSEGYARGQPCVYVSVDALNSDISIIFDSE